MDLPLNRAWRDRQAPFDGHTIVLAAPTPIDNLIDFVKRIVVLLKSRYPYAGLRKVDDWHAHDRALLESSDFDWMHLDRLLESTEAFSDAVSDDDYVRLGIYDQDRQFYLRFGYSPALQRSTSDLTHGDFDLSGSLELCRAVEAVVKPMSTRVIPAAKYFDESFAGG